MGNRRKAREMALQTLYQSELSGNTPTDAFDIFCRNFETNKKAVAYARELVYGVTAKMSTINAMIEKHSANWRMSRMSVVDRNILRLATFEMCISQQPVPASVVINEALEVARRYSTDDSIPFINGILDAMRKKMESRDV
jgi:N utilization substance protein B